MAPAECTSDRRKFVHMGRVVASKNPRTLSTRYIWRPADERLRVELDTFEVWDAQREPNVWSIYTDAGPLVWRTERRCFAGPPDPKEGSSGLRRTELSRTSHHFDVSSPDCSTLQRLSRGGRDNIL